MENPEMEFPQYLLERFIEMCDWLAVRRYYLHPLLALGLGFLGHGGLQVLRRSYIPYLYDGDGLYRFPHCPVCSNSKQATPEKPLYSILTRPRLFPARKP